VLPLSRGSDLTILDALDFLVGVSESPDPLSADPAILMIESTDREHRVGLIDRNFYLRVIIALG